MESGAAAWFGGSVTRPLALGLNTIRGTMKVMVRTMVMKMVMVVMMVMLPMVMVKMSKIEKRMEWNQ